MAGFRTHIGVSSALGVVYGGAAANPGGFEAEDAVLSAILTGFGGMLPDLDSDSGRPVKELFGLAGAVVPLMLMPRLHNMQLTHEGMLLVLIGLYFTVRYGLSWILGHISVHRGMFHSVPAMLIAGLFVYLEYGSKERELRLLLAGGVMAGFLSHLILKSSAGSALKFFSPSFFGTTVCYLILGGLGTVAYLDYKTAGKLEQLTGLIREDASKIEKPVAKVEVLRGR
jgi:membrane-bound metal-dependent hydrolase YbcI (DUF457 family)